MRMGLMSEDYAGEVTPELTCDIELLFQGPTTKVLDAWCAEALRKLADRIEKGEFESGHHPVKNNIGMEIGSIYIDYSGVILNA